MLGKIKYLGIIALGVPRSKVKALPFIFQNSEALKGKAPIYRANVSQSKDQNTDLTLSFQTDLPRTLCAMGREEKKTTQRSKMMLAVNYCAEIKH